MEELTPPGDVPLGDAPSAATAAEQRAEQAEVRAARRARIQLDRVLSLSAALVALCALAVSVYQTKIMREQQRASAWPSLYLYSSNVDGWSREVRNLGLGPALVRSVVVTVDSQPVRDWGDALERLGDKPLMDSVERAAARDTSIQVFTNTFARGSVLLPGEKTVLVRVTPPSLGRRIERTTRGRRLAIEVCYCSFYDDCWTVGTRRMEPESVRACVADSTRQFR